MNKILSNIPSGYALIVIVFGLLLVPLAPQKALATLTAAANHDRIAVDSFYNGSTVNIKGECDADTDLIIKISSREGHVTLKKKGKAAGVVWMNVGDLRFENVPNLYFVNSTKDLDKIIDKKTAGEYVLGYNTLGQHIDIEPVADQSEKAKWFNELVKLKEESNLYSEGVGEIQFADQDGGKRSYSMSVAWPYQAPPSDYDVDVFAVRGGSIVERAHATISVERAGAVKYLTSMAMNNGAMYGLVAIVVALLSGIGAGLVFGKGGGAH